MVRFYSCAGAKESFEEPKDLTGRIRELLKMDKKAAANASTETDSTEASNSSSKGHSSTAESKDDEPEKVKKCDKV